MAAGPAGLRHARRRLRLVSVAHINHVNVPTPCGVSKSAAHENDNQILFGDYFCSYGISVGLGHIPAFLPYISDAGVLAPGEQLRL